MAEIGKGIPQVGMRFRDVDEAWAFWDAYRGHTGFDVRKRYANKSRLDGQAGNYEVTEVVLEHNHLLQLPQTRHLMISQRKISKRQAFEIETADDFGITPQAVHEFASRQVGGPISLGYTWRDQKNHLRTKRQRELAYGQAGTSVQPQVQVENDGTNRGGSPIAANVKRQEYDTIDSFTELLTASRVEDDILYDDLIWYIQGC